jgi:hypothetical protein
MAAAFKIDFAAHAKVARANDGRIVEVIKTLSPSEAEGLRNRTVSACSFADAFPDIDIDVKKPIHKASRSTFVQPIRKGGGTPYHSEFHT